MYELHQSQLRTKLYCCHCFRFRLFKKCFEHPDSSAPTTAPLPLPPLRLRGFIQDLESCILEHSGLCEGSTLYEIAVVGGGSAYDEGDPSLAAAFLSSYASRALRWTAALCDQLALPAGGAPASQALPAAFGAEGAALPSNSGVCGGAGGGLAVAACRLIDYVLTSHLQLAFGQHMAVPVACRCASAPCRMHRYFINQHYLSFFPV